MFIVINPDNAVKFDKSIVLKMKFETQTHTAKSALLALNKKLFWDDKDQQKIVKSTIASYLGGLGTS